MCLQAIDPNTVVDIHRYVFSRAKGFKRLLLPLNELFHLFFYKPYYAQKNKNKKAPFLFFKTLHRSDYNLLFEEIFSTCHKDKIIIEVSDKFSLDPMVLIYLKDAISSYKHIESTSLLEKIYLFMAFMRYIKYLKIVNQYQFSVLVVFADMQPADNMITQYCRHEKKTTVTLSHGLGVEYTDFDNINSVNYRNVVSEYYLAWGDENKKLVLKYHPSCNVVVCGNPTIKPLENICRVDSEPYFIVLFDTTIFDKQNLEMLEIANQVAERKKYKFHVRFHPVNKPSNYNIIEKYRSDFSDLGGASFVLGHTSTMIHACMRLGLATFKYDSPIPSYSVDTDRIFKTSEELIAKLDNISQYKTEVLSHIRYIDKEAASMYNKFFTNLLNFRTHFSKDRHAVKPHGIAISV